MKRFSIRSLLILILSFLFLGCLAVWGCRLFRYQNGAEIYREARKLANVPDPAELVSPRPTVSTIDLSALHRVNRDVLGWITIPDTVLSYPVVQTGDNDFYLNHSWDRADSSVGAVFMETKCSPDFTDFNTILYGHRMNDGSMFGSLKHYKKQAYYEAHPLFYLMDESGIHIYQIFSAFEARPADPVFLLNVSDEEDRQAVINCALEKSLLKADRIPAAEDSIVTLSTCTGHGHDTRFVVLGVLLSTQTGQSPSSGAS